MESSLAILVIDENKIRASIIEAGLRESGHDNVTVVHDIAGVARTIAAINPDVIVIDLENPNRDVLENMFQLSRAVKRPVAMFVDRADRASIEAAVEAGVSAYVVDGLNLDPFSNASYGGFLKGKRPVGDKLSYDYRLEYARQTNYGDSPIDYEVDYVRVEQGLTFEGFTTTLIYELLGSDNAIAAFQTPLATGHIFNGFADVFLVTPPTGLQDFYVEAKYKVSSKSRGPFSYFEGLLLLAQYHEFRSAVRDLDYGSEFDFYTYLPLRNGIYAQLKYANYQADEFFTDVEKVIFGLGYQY